MLEPLLVASWTLGGLTHLIRMETRLRVQAQQADEMARRAREDYDRAREALLAPPAVVSRAGRCDYCGNAAVQDPPHAHRCAGCGAPRVTPEK